MTQPILAGMERHSPCRLPTCRGDGTVVRLIDVAALGVGIWLVGTFLFWSEWSRSLWARPEHVFLLLFGITSLRLLVAPVAVPTVNPHQVVAVGVMTYALIFSFVTVTHHGP